MSDQQRYDPVMMADHVSAQKALVGHLSDLRTQAQSAIESIRDEWTGQGFGNCDEAHRQIAAAFDQVFQTIMRHGAAIQTAADHSVTTDSGVGAGFVGI